MFSGSPTLAATRAVTHVLRRREGRVGSGLTTRYSSSMAVALQRSQACRHACSHAGTNCPPQACMHVGAGKATMHAPQRQDMGHSCECQQSITRQPAAGMSSRSVADRWRRCVALISHSHHTVQPCEAHKWRHLTPVWSWKVISTPCRSSSWQGDIKGGAKKG